MKRVLVIRTADKEFGEQLAKNFNRSTDQFFQTFVFSESETFKEFAKTHVPMGRYGKAGELNAGVIFLASDEASYVTGAILPIDGGYTCV